MEAIPSGSNNDEVFISIRASPVDFFAGLMVLPDCCIEIEAIEPPPRRLPQAVCSARGDGSRHAISSSLAYLGEKPLGSEGRTGLSSGTFILATHFMKGHIYFH